MNKVYFTLLVMSSLLITLICGCTSSQVLNRISNIENETSAIKKDSDLLKSNLDGKIQKLRTGVQKSDGQLEKKINDVKNETSAIKKDSDLLKSSLYDKIQKLRTEVHKSDGQLEKKINDIKNETSTIREDSELLKLSLDDKIQKLRTEVQGKVHEFETAAQKSNKQPENSMITKISDLNEVISEQKRYWIIAILILLLIIAGLILYLKYKIVWLNNIFSSKLDSSVEDLKNETIRLDAKLIQIMESQLKDGGQQLNQGTELDHSFPIKVCEEIQRMRNRMKHMDQDDQATKVFSKRLASIEEKLNSMGYEMGNLENTPYREGMTVEARFISNENMNEGEEIITRVMKPQINYNGVLIKAADVEVSQGSKVN